MVRLTVDSLTGFSVAPLRLATMFGLGGAAITFLLLVFAFAAWLTGRTVPGWTSTFVAVAGVGTVQLLCLGLLGEYVGRMYVQLQGRPAYFVAWDSADAALPGTVSARREAEPADAEAPDHGPAAVPRPSPRSSAGPVGRQDRRDGLRPGGAQQ